MLDFYINRIKAGLMSIDDVPTFWKDKVKKVLKPVKARKK